LRHSAFFCENGRFFSYQRILLSSMAGSGSVRQTYWLLYEQR
jgi:hypothetical protein